jgi:hypothetical protein
MHLPLDRVSDVLLADLSDVRLPADVDISIMVFASPRKRRYHELLKRVDIVSREHEAFGSKFIDGALETGLKVILPPFSLQELVSLNQITKPSLTDRAVQERFGEIWRRATACVFGQRWDGGDSESR